MLHDSLPSDVKIAIGDAAEAVIDQILHLLAAGKITDFETLHSYVELGILTIDHTSIADLRLKIAEASTTVLCSLARTEAAAAFQDLERILDEEDIDLTSVSTTNAFAWARHESESDHGQCHVYHYRNVEGNHADVLEFELCSCRSVFLTRPVDAGELSPGERTFDAS